MIRFLPRPNASRVSKPIFTSCFSELKIKYVFGTVSAARRTSPSTAGSATAPEPCTARYNVWPSTACVCRARTRASARPVDVSSTSYLTAPFSRSSVIPELFESVYYFLHNNKKKEKKEKKKKSRKKSHM
ncbi:hypothetical protein PUN28_012421 [Cardiocondyla obscurior]|uniref:Uncharacterized protein n=1 Tax=Cardiocondyla obscurior TaxID=286306 RepID=A0AAW2FCP7_9HYME